MLAVADGMGGAPAGDRASALVIEAFERPPAEDDEPERYLRAALGTANRAIEADAARDPERAGMGSTLVAAVVRGTDAWIIHVGDSRAYLWRDRELSQLTEDHSAAGEAVRAGRLDPEAARFDARRHLLTRVVGGVMSEPDLTGRFTLDERSVLLLVTDGVCGVIADDGIAAALEAHRGIGVARALVDAAYETGAPDNIGIALLDERP